MPNPGDLVICQSGFEALLGRELESLGGAPAETGPGWVLAGPGGPCARAAFAHAVLESAAAVSGASVNELAQAIVDVFATSLAGERVDGPWPCLFLSPPEPAGLARRVSGVEAAFRERLGRRLGRVARLAGAGRPRIGSARGLFVWFSDFGRAHVSRSAQFLGPCRMADDPLAPSRSYLKVEEAYGIVGTEPSPGRVVCDLGAAPGGWSYSAAKRGAQVVAVDNGPLKGGALGHPLIDHRRDDAFGFSPGRDKVYDWLFCDMLEDPHKVLRSVVAPWLREGWCRRFVVNLKFGRVDPVQLLGDLRSAGSPLGAARNARICHLYHDREEFTVTGEVAP